MRLVIIDDETNTTGEIHENIDGAMLNVPSVRGAVSRSIMSRIIDVIELLKKERITHAVQTTNT